MKILELAKEALSLGFYSADESKSLRDMAFIGEQLETGSGAVGIARTNLLPTNRLFNKRNVRTLRNYAEYSIWVRAAIDIYRDVVALAQYVLLPADAQKPVNEKIKSEIVALLNKPNALDKPYSEMLEEFAEDFLVLGHGAFELLLRNDATPYEIRSLDAARFAFQQGWDGNPRSPRYAILDPGTMRTERYLANPMAMVLVNRSRTYDLLGLSHVEVLDLAVRALLETDDYFLREAQNPSKAGALDLGTGVTQPQVDEVRAQIDGVRRPFIVMGGSEGAQYIPFTASERELRMLDRQTWFVRQVAAIFQVSIAKLQVKAEAMNRASTEAQLDEMDEGPGALLWRICQAENKSILGRFGTVEEHNLKLDYPILSQKDEKRQAEINKVRTGNSAWITTNEARRDEGKEPLDMAVADDILIPTSKGPVPLSVLQREYFDNPQDDEADDDIGDNQADESEDNADDKALLSPPVS
ncbi:MAG: phage portal protein [Acidobacteria bacterium]|nr:phage portal protein [Acidobacteriota bacterium]